MDALFDGERLDNWHLTAQQPTLAIGLSFIFLAYCLHPRIVTAYQRVRASRAWKAVQNHERVDVTNYSMWEQAFGVRGNMGAARTVSVLLAAFSLASWVLELSLDIFDVDGNALLLIVPPHVYKNNNSAWQVMTMEEINPDYDGKWKKLDNMDENEAKSRYYVMGYQEFPWSEKINKYVNGKIVVANWDRNNKPKDSDDKVRFFFGDDDTVQVVNITCTGEDNETLVGTRVYLGPTVWGSVLQCGQGPKKMDEEKDESQPAIILTNDTTGAVHVIMEEVGTHPSFLYSVWNASSNSSTDLAYTFHISSTVRLAEAIVTGIVHGEASGGYCFGLLRMFSGEDILNKTTSEFNRAKPFGEKPEGGNVTSLKDVETLAAGVLMNTFALVAFVCLLLLTLIGIGWSRCLKSSIEIDVFDRDELLRTISNQVQGEPNDPSRHSAMRIYVQRELSGELNVVISEVDDAHNYCERFLLRREPTPYVHPVPAVDTVRSNALDDFGGAPLPVGRPRMYLGDIRVGMGRAYPGRNRNYRYPLPAASSVALSASPVPSNVGSPGRTPDLRASAGRGLPVMIVPSPVPPRAGTCSMGTPAVGTPTAAFRQPRPSGFLSSFRGAGGGWVGNFGAEGRGVSALFENVSTLGDSDGGGRETDGDGNSSPDTDMGSGALARPQALAFGGDGSGDAEKGSLELVRPQTSAYGGDQGGPNARRWVKPSGCLPIDTTGGQRGNSGGAVGEDRGDAQHPPFRRDEVAGQPGAIVSSATSWADDGVNARPSAVTAANPGLGSQPGAVVSAATPGADDGAFSRPSAARATSPDLGRRNNAQPGVIDS